MERFLNKKRERKSGSSDGEEELIFGRCKKVIRSPEYRQIENKKKESDTTNMEEIKEMIKQLMEEVKRNGSEIRALKEEMKKKEEKWEKEKQKMNEKIENLEGKIEKFERDKKKNNIVIKGISITDEDTVGMLKDFIKQKLNVEAKIKTAYRMGKNNRFTYVAEMENWDKKQEVMKNKHQLKGTKVYIDNDLTVEERKIQTTLREIAKDNIGKGKKVKIGYQKLIINDEIYKWDNKEEGVVAMGQALPKN